MAYQANIPQPTDQLSQSQSDILGNFQEINTWTAVNHVGFGSADQGKHEITVFMQQNALNNAQIAAKFANATDNGIYNFLSPSTNLQELYVHRANTIVAQDIPFTAQAFGVVPNRGWTYMPSGILMKYGTATLDGASPAKATINLNAIGPAYSAIYSINLTGLATTQLQTWYTVDSTGGTGTTPSQLVVFGQPNGNSTSFYFTVIGV